MSVNAEQARYGAKLARIAMSDAGSPSSIVNDGGLKHTNDSGEIDATIDKILAANADKVPQYKGPKKVCFGFAVGQTMKAKRKANRQVIHEPLRARLG